MGVRDASRSRPVMCWKRYCGSQHRRAMAHAAAKLSELQNCASTLSNWCCNEILRLGFDGRCQRAFRQRRAG